MICRLQRHSTAVASHNPKLRIMREGPYDAQRQIRHGRILASERQVFLHKDDMDAPISKAQHYSPQIVEVAGQPVHRVTEHRISLTDETLHGLQLGPVHILARGFVSEGLVRGQPFELSNFVLIQRADAQAADPLAFGRFARSSGSRCPNRLCELRYYQYDKLESDSITTLFRRRSDVGLGYTPAGQQH